jgi:hypothetical protein
MLLVAIQSVAKAVDCPTQLNRGKAQEAPYLLTQPPRFRRSAVDRPSRTVSACIDLEFALEPTCFLADPPLLMADVAKRVKGGQRGSKDDWRRGQDGVTHAGAGPPVLKSGAVTCHHCRNIGRPRCWRCWGYIGHKGMRVGRVERDFVWAGARRVS